MKEWGLTDDHYPEPNVDVWDEAWDAVQLFSSISTQWRVGSGGVVGLDYAIVYREAERRKIDLDDEFMWAIGVIENAAMAEIHKEIK